MADERIILVVGACGLDRLLTVEKYPAADAKIRTSSYHEIGGGNAANTAAAIGRLADAQFVKDSNIKVKYLGKVGQDEVGQQVIDELKESNVDVSSPLCLRGPAESTTSFTTVIVDQNEHTRTCFHTPGSCGMLDLDDCLRQGANNMDIIFENVVHLHSDTRHISASLFLAKEARKRHVTVSCDCEKDRHSSDLDELLTVSDIVFTNSNYLGGYLARLTKEYEESHSLQPLPHLAIHDYGSFDKRTKQLLVGSMTPISFLSRWNPRLEKQVVVTQGGMGALHYQPEMIHNEEDVTTSSSQGVIALNEVKIEKLASEFGDIARLLYRFRALRTTDDNPEQTKCCLYNVKSTGVSLNAPIVDTTGAGDAFIGGYILASCASTQNSSQTIHFNMQFGSWVAGKKIGGVGVRDALPKGCDVDAQLGPNTHDIYQCLKETISEFIQQVPS